MSDQILKQFLFGRMALLDAVKDVSNEVSVIVPEFSNNHIKWNVAHVAVVVDQMLFAVKGIEPSTPAEWKTYFGGGTKPTSGELLPYSLEEILEIVKSQANRVKEEVSPFLKDELSKPINIRGNELKIVEDILLFMVWHEATHIGIIKTLAKAVK